MLIAPVSARTIFYGDPVERSHPLNRGLVGWWLPLPQQSGGLRLLDVVNRLHGTLTNGVGWAPGRHHAFPGNGFASASSQYVDLGDPAALATTQWTVEAWIYPTSFADHRVIFGRNNVDSTLRTIDLDLEITTGKVRLYFTSASSTYVGFTANTGLSLNRWTHVLGSYDGATMRVCLNGVSDGTFATSATPTTGGATYGSAIGRLGLYTASAYFDGRIAGVSFRNRGVSASEASRLYYEAARGYPELLRRLRGRAYSLPAGTTHTRSLSDTLAAQDLFARLANAARSLTDTLGLSDAYARTSAALRALSDTLATSDTFARVAAANRAFTDTAAMADAFARTANGLRSLSDSLTAADAFARVSDANRSLSDTLALADAYSRVSTANRTLTDTAGFAEVYARVADAIRAYTEGVGLSDVFARVADALRLFADTLALSDLATLVRITPGTLQIAVADALGIANAYARTADANRAMADTLGLADALLRVTAANRLLSDSVSATDAFARTADALRLLPDALGVAEAFARQSDASRAISEATGFSEAFARQADAVRLLAESLGLADSASLSAAIIGLVLGPFYIDAACVYVAGADPAAAYVAGAQAAKGGTG